MKKSMTLSANAPANSMLSNLTASMANNIAAIASIVKSPVELLRKYFSTCIGHEISIRRTWLIIQAQVAFFVTVFTSECPLALRAIFAVWFLVSVVRCSNDRA